MDAIIDALLAADVDTVMNAITWQQHPCATNWTGGFPGPPPCAAGETDGTLVTALPLGGSESESARPEAIRALLDSELPRNRALCEFQTHDAGRRVIRLRLATAYPGQENAAVTDDLTFTIVDGRIVSIGT